MNPPPNLKWLEDPGVPLCQFCRHMGVGLKVLMRSEGVRHLQLDEPVEISSLMNLELSQAQALIQAYGPALKCSLLCEDDGTQHRLDIGQGISERDLRAFQQQADVAHSARLEIIIDKAELARWRLAPPPGCRPFLFFFAATLKDFLRSEPERLRRVLWGKEPDCCADKVVLFVPRRSLRLNGPYLAVLGGADVHAWPDILPAAAPDLAAIQEIYESARDTTRLKWVDFRLGCLTPLHLELKGDHPARNPIANALFVHLVNLFILYTADRTERRDGGRYEATYAGANQTVTFDLAKPGAFLNKSFEATEWLIKMVAWAYERAEKRDWSRDRLPMVQIATCQALRTAERADRYQLLVLNAGNICRDLEWHWKVFIEDKFDAYTAKVRELEDYVDGIVGAFSDEVTAMIDSLSKTMLAAVGVVVGSFIASVFKDQFNPAVFTLAMLAYAAYVFLFPMIYGMAHTWGRYQAKVTGFEERRERFEGYLYAQRVEEIVGDRVEKARRRFRLWFWITLGTYLIVIELAIQAAFWVPWFVA